MALPEHPTRRAVLARLAGMAGMPVAGGPVFERGGFDAARYGMDQGYPVPPRAQAIAQGNPWSAEDRVGAFSHLDEIYPTQRIARAAAPWAFTRSAAQVRYELQGRETSLEEYLARRPVTGLLIARDGEILYEHYRYGRTDQDRLLGQSMTKSITGLLVGLALADGAIRSLDDTPETYVAGFRGTEYGRTPLRDLLHLSSGVDFGEERDGGRDLTRLWRDMVMGAGVFGKKGTVASLTQFNQRVAPPGTRYHYASIEADVLAVVLRQALGQPLSAYLQARLWQPIGAEADATWLVDAEGIELGHFGFSAVLRDYARLGRLLACDGAWDGRQVLPAAWLFDATTVSSPSHYLAPGQSMRFGYGYLLWLLPGSRRQFALVGQNGQRLCVDPRSRLVMVHTALEDMPEAWLLWADIVRQLG